MHIGQGLACLPCDPARQTRCSGIDFSLGRRYDGDETPVGPAMYAGRQGGHVLGRPAGQLGIQGRWTQHPPVQHARPAQVLDETRMAVDLVCQIDTFGTRLTQQTALRHGLGLRCAGTFDVQVHTAQQVSVVTEVLPLCRQKTAGLHRDRFGRLPGQDRRTLQGQGPDLRTGLTQSAATVLHRQTAGRHTFVGAMGCAGTVNAHALHGHIQFFGHEQQQGRQDALPEFDLAGKDLHHTGFGETQPLREATVGMQAAWQLGAAILAVDDKTAGLGARQIGHGVVGKLHMHRRPLSPPVDERCRFVICGQIFDPSHLRLCVVLV